MLVQVTAPHFCAGIEVEDINPLGMPDRRVTAAAPILKYMIGWPSDKASKFLKHKGWKAVVCHERRNSE